MQAVALETLQGLSGRLVGLGLLHSLWISLAVASLAALVFQSCPRLSHQARYLILLAALSLVAIGPIVAVPLHQALASSTTSVERPTELIVVASAMSNPVEQPSAAGRPLVRSANEASSFRSRVPPFVTIALSQTLIAICHYEPALVALWLVGMAALTSFLVVGARAVQKTCREARPAEPAIQVMVDDLARRATLKSVPRVVIHPSVIEPHLCGLFRPVIVLPERSLCYGDGKQLEAILGHELAHARRYDHFVNLAQRLVEVTLFFSPTVHWLSRSLRQHREFCADALAVRLTRDPLALARALESVARLRFEFPAQPAAGSALGGPNTSLLPRIQELIGMTPSRPGLSAWPFAALPAAGLVALIAVAAGLAQNQPSVTSPPIPAATDPSIHRGSPSPRSRSQPEKAVGTAYAVSSDRQVRDEVQIIDLGSNRQISYEVQIIELGAEPWQASLKDQRKLAQQDANVAAWIVDQVAMKETLRDIFKMSSTNTEPANILQCPKPTTYENHTLMIHTNAAYYSAVLERANVPGTLGAIKPDETAASRLATAHGATGTVIELKGLISPGGIRLSADLHDSCLAPISSAGGKDKNREKTVDGLSPAIAERRCQAFCELPEGGTLVVSMGFREGRGRHSNLGEAANELLQLVGLPRIPAKRVARERLILITPRAILLDAEERLSPFIKGFFDDTPRVR